MRIETITSAQNQKIKLFVPCQIHGNCTVIGAFHLISLIFQIELDPLHNDRLIVYH